VVMFRFDMDALPVTEETGAEYASQVQGRCMAVAMTATWRWGWVCPDAGGAP